MWWVWSSKSHGSPSARDSLTCSRVFRSSQNNVYVTHVYVNRCSHIFCTTLSVNIFREKVMPFNGYNKILGEGYKCCLLGGKNIQCKKFGMIYQNLQNSSKNCRGLGELKWPTSGYRPSLFPFSFPACQRGSSIPCGSLRGCRSCESHGSVRSRELWSSSSHPWQLSGIRRGFGLVGSAEPGERGRGWAPAARRGRTKCWRRRLLWKSLLSPAVAAGSLQSSPEVFTLRACFGRLLPRSIRCSGALGRLPGPSSARPHR